MVLTSSSAGLRRILLISMLSSAIYSLDVAGMANALATYQFKLGLTFAEGQWIANLSTIVYAATVLIMGWLGDRRGVRSTMTLGALLYGVSAVLGWLAGSLGLAPLLVVARILTGISFGLVVVQSAAILTAYLPLSELGRHMGTVGAVSALVAAFAPPVLGVVIQTIGWYWIFVPPLLVALVLLGLLRTIPSLPQHGQLTRLDRVGVVTSALGVLFLFSGAQQATALGFTAWQVWALIGLGLALLGAFALIERRKAGAALFDVRVFSDREFTLSALLMGIGILVQVYAGAMLLRMLQEVELLRPAEAALSATVLGVSMAVGSSRAGRVLDLRGARTVYLWGSGLAALALVLLALGVWSRQSLALVPGLILAGVSWSFCRQSRSHGMRRVPAEQHSRAASSFSLFAQTGLGFGFAIVSSLLVLLQSIILSRDLAAVGAAADQVTHVADLLNRAFGGDTSRLSNLPPERVDQFLTIARSGTAEAYAIIGFGLAVVLALLFLLMHAMPRPDSVQLGGIVGELTPGAVS